MSYWKKAKFAKKVLIDAVLMFPLVAWLSSRNGSDPVSDVLTGVKRGLASALDFLSTCLL